MLRTTIACAALIALCTAYVNSDVLTYSSPAADDQFGFAVATDGDSTVVGIPGEGVNSGGCVIYTDNAGTWTQSFVLDQVVQVSSEANDVLGYDVDISGDVAVCGAPMGDGGSFFEPSGSPAFWTYPDIGLVTLLTRDALGDWSELKTIRAPALQQFQQFGRSVAIDGDILVVGAPFKGGSDQGSVYVFHRNEGSSDNWGLQAELTDTGFAPSLYFGLSVDVHNGTVVVGSPRDDDGGADAGAVFLYAYNNASSTWELTDKITAAGSWIGDQFGQSVSLDNDTLVVGAIGDDTGTSNAGAAYILVKDPASGWVEQATVVGSSPQADAEFGASVSVNGDALLVGARYWDHPQVSDVGQSYLFLRNNGLWSELDIIQKSAGSVQDYFGFDVALGDSYAFVGAPWTNPGSRNNAGEVYVFTVCGSGTVEPGEECDDGNTVSGDGCNSCILEFCGDGILNNGGEECDDGNSTPDDGCTGCVVDPCPPGFVGPQWDSCSACPRGAYKEDAGTGSCTPCPANTTTAALGSSNSSQCLGCDPGQFLNSQGNCEACAVGTYQALADQGSCMPCPANATTASTGSTAGAQCFECEPGKFLNSDGTCEACGPQSYQDEAGQASCKVCSPGTWSNATDTGRTTDCSPCSAGMYAAYSGWQGFSSCNPCWHGTWSEQGASECTSCGIGYTTAQGFSTSPDDCYQCPAGTGNCLECSENYYQPQAGQGECISCPVGSVLDERGATSGDGCTPCPANTVITYGGFDAMEYCRDCPAGTISAPGTAQFVADGDYVEEPTCFTCAANEIVVSAGGQGGCGTCEPGLVPDAAQLNCIEPAEEGSATPVIVAASTAGVAGIAGVAAVLLRRRRQSMEAVTKVETTSSSAASTPAKV